MGSRGEEETKEKYDRVCRELNLDQESMDAAWTSYLAINNDYVLEVRIIRAIMKVCWSMIRGNKLI